MVFNNRTSTSFHGKYTGHLEDNVFAEVLAAAGHSDQN
jgi:hypothetical protein